MKKHHLVIVAVIAVVAVAAVSAAIAGTPVSQNDDGAVLNQPGGPQATLTGDVTVYNDSGGVSESQILWSTSEGDAAFYSTGDTEVTVAASGLEGVWTNTTDVDASAADLTIGPGDKGNFTISGTADRLDFRDASVDDGVVDVYIDGGGAVEIEPMGLPADTTVYAVDAPTGKLVDVKTTGSSGQAAFDFELGTGRHVVSYTNGDLKHDWATTDRAIRFVTTDPRASTPIILDADSGPNVTIEGSTELNTADPFPYSNTVDAQTDAGNLTVISNGASSITVQAGNIEGAFTNVTGVNAGSSTIQMDPGDKKPLFVDGAATEVAWSDYALDDEAVDTVVTGPDGTSTALTYDNIFTDGATYTAINTSSNTPLDVADADGDSVSFDIGHSTKSIELQSGDQSEAPEISNADPVGGQSQPPGNLSVDVSDADFPDDEVEVAIDYDGTEIKRVNITSDSTVTADLDSTPLGGSHDWTVTATDRFGNTTSETYTFSVPDKLYIYNESEPTEKLDNTSASIEFYFDRDDTADLIETRNTSNGTLDMTGLPPDEPFVVVAQSDGYFNRRIYVPSLFETQRIYLLDENATAVQPTFRLIDFTGNFPRESTVIEAQRSINGTWQTVEGDYFGAANEMTAQLAYNERHRIIITNVHTGVSRDLGVFTPTATTTTELEVHTDDVIINEDFMPTLEISPSVGSLPAKAGVEISAAVGLNGAEFSEYTITAKLENGTTLYNQTYTSGSGGEHNFTVDVSGAEGRSLVVLVDYETAEGGSGTMDTTFSIREFIENDYSLLSVVTGADMGGETPNTLSVLMVLVFAIFGTGFAATQLQSGPAGLVGLTIVAGGALVGWIPFGWLAAGGITWVVMSGVSNRI